MSDGRWSVANYVAAGGRKALRRELERGAWSAGPVARANPEGYWRSAQGACAVMLSFDAGGGQGSPREALLRVAIDLASWRGGGPLAGSAASQRRWDKALVELARAQCKLTYGPEAVMARRAAEGHPLRRALLKAVGKDARALAPALGEGFWPVSVEIIPPPEGFMDGKTCEPSERRSLPLIHCRFEACKPLGPEGSQSAVVSIKGRLAEMFGAQAAVEMAPGGRLGSLQWRSMLEGLAIAQGMAAEGGGGGAVSDPEPAPRAARPRL